MAVQTLCRFMNEEVFFFFLTAAANICVFVCVCVRARTCVCVVVFFFFCYKNTNFVLGSGSELTMLTGHSVETYQENELTRNS